MHRFVSVISFSLALCVVGGCSTPQQSAPPPSATVKGTVTLDGKPMETGEIRFGVMGQPPKVSPIKGGEFSGEGYVGANLVEVVLMKDGPPSTTEKVICRSSAVRVTAPRAPRVSNF